MKKIPVVFFGSGPVATRSLELLVSDFEVVAVITKPKPPHHKEDFPVITLSKKLNLPVYTVSNNQELSSLLHKNIFKTELAILIDFGIIISRDVIDYFPRGILNSHFSLLPQLRGADPITFAILSGQDKTGVSLMLIDEGMDTGKIIGQKSISVGSDTNASQLTEKLIALSNQLLSLYVPRYLANLIIPREQPHPDRATYSRKLTKDDGILNFNKPAKELEREIRAFHAWPKSRTKLASVDVIITSTSVENYRGEVGNFEIIDKQLIIYCKTDALGIKRLKPAGKSEMTSEAFIAGYSSKLAANN